MSASPILQKQDIPGELRRVANTLSDDAQNAASRKGKELAFDLDKGKIPFEETLINLSSARDILLDAIERGKLMQLPLKLQFILLSEAEKASQALTALANGTDAVVNLEDAVEELTASIWQFNLHNLSDQVLGLHSKMNQLKSLETRLRQASKDAEEVTSHRTNAQKLLGQVSEIASSAAEQKLALQSSTEAVDAILRKATEQDQKVSAISAQIEQHETTSATQLANSKQAAADTKAIADKSKELQGEIESTRNALKELTAKTQEFLIASENTVSSNLSEFNSRYNQVSTSAQNLLNTWIAKAETSLTDLVTASNTKIASLNVNLQQSSAAMEGRLTKLVTESTERLAQSEAAQETRLTSHLKESNNLNQEQLAKVAAEFAELKKSASDAVQGQVQTSETEVRRIITQLEELEGRIKESIDRATGYSLFHSFQTRQLNVAKSKRFWGYMLGALVLISLCASGVFIWSLQFVHEYNAAFFLKLSISIPLIYGIAFCNVQYSRERRLEEEYAFKSNISISLDPYQKLVAGLVDKTKPEELAKYTAFVIDSVNRVFTSPTEKIFDDRPADTTSAEKLIKALGGLLNPLVKALKK